MPNTGRPERVAEEMREVLAEEIARLKDPRVGFVTVTGVRMTPDLRRAWIFFTSYGDDTAKAGTRAALRSARPYLRAAVGRQVRLKFLPEIEFEEDATIEAGERIDRLIAEAHREGSDDG